MGQIAGILIGTIWGFFIILTIGMCVCMKRRESNEKKENSEKQRLKSDEKPESGQELSKMENGKSK